MISKVEESVEMGNIEILFWRRLVISEVRRNRSIDSAMVHCICESKRLSSEISIYSSNNFALTSENYNLQR